MDRIIHFEDGKKRSNSYNWNHLCYAICGADLCDEKGNSIGVFTRDEWNVTCNECLKILQSKKDE